jgi:hypothetical protein
MAWEEGAIETSGEGKGLAIGDEYVVECGEEGGVGGFLLRDLREQR